jgi:hypothetical protein
MKKCTLSVKAVQFWWNFQNCDLVDRFCKRVSNFCKENLWSYWRWSNMPWMTKLYKKLVWKRYILAGSSSCQNIRVCSTWGTEFVACICGGPDGRCVNRDNYARNMFGQQINSCFVMTKFLVRSHTVCLYFMCKKNKGGLLYLTIQL